jgi:rhamnogalacturonyl hydrolase YesR
MRSRLLAPISVLAVFGLLGAACANRSAVKPGGGGGPGADDGQIRDIVKRVARHQLRPLADGDYPVVDGEDVIKAADAVKQPEGIQWVYPWGVTLYGALRSTDTTGDSDVESFVLQHNQICARNFVWLDKVKEKAGPETEETKAFIKKTKVRGLLNLGNLDSCGAMGNQMLEGILRHRDQETAEEKAAVARIADWIVNKQARTSDGTLWRPKSMDGTIWIDDLYMAGPFLVRWSKYTGDGKYLTDAAHQIINMAARLKDTDGVWYHAYFENKKQRSPFKWGRANGWAMVATVEVLSEMPENHPDRAALLDILRQQINGVEKLQAPSGMWRQVLDHPELWEETSATAMFAYSIARAVNRGWIPAEHLAVARRAFAGIAQQVTPDGVVKGTCAGTNIGMELDYYVKRERPDDDLHGRGVVMLAGTEILLNNPANAAAPKAASPTPSAYACTEVIGVSVTGDWFNAGFEDGPVDNSRWQVRWKSHAFIEGWADPKNELWSLPPQSPCAARSNDPDHVIFTGVNWQYKTQDEWQQKYIAVVETLKARYPGLKRIDLLTMLRGPQNKSCGSTMTVVEPFIDAALASVVAKYPGLVFPGPKVETPTCEIFTKGGPHFTPQGMATAAKLYNASLR